MQIKLSELYEKEVICIKDGARMGEISDVQICSETGNISSILIYGKARLFGLLGRTTDFIIDWSAVEVIGDDVILVNIDLPDAPARKHLSLSRYFNDL